MELRGNVGENRDSSGRIDYRQRRYVTTNDTDFALCHRKVPPDINIVARCAIEGEEFGGARSCCRVSGRRAGSPQEPIHGLAIRRPFPLNVAGGR